MAWKQKLITTEINSNNCSNTGMKIYKEPYMEIKYRFIHSSNNGRNKIDDENAFLC